MRSALISGARFGRYDAAMDNALLPSLPVHWLIARAAIVYAVVYVALRLAGKRQVSQMGAAELMALLMLSDAVQNSMVGTDSSLSGGLICAMTLLGLSVALEYLGFRFKRVETLIEGTPTIIIYRGKIREDAMNREWMGRHDLRSMLRKQGVQSPAEVDLAVLESDGSLSIVKHAKRDEDNTPGASRDRPL